MGPEDSGKLRDDEDPGDVKVMFLKQYIAIYIDFASQPNQMNGSMLSVESILILRR